MMPTNDSVPVVNLTEREKLVQLQPCFSRMTQAECHELAGLTTVESYVAGQAIVEQDAVVDCVYLIVDGHAEVTQRQQDGDKSYYIPLAIFGPCEAIGLSEKGLFSATGKRTATVTALTRMTLLKLDVAYLNEFLARYAHIPIEILASSDKMLRTHFIKRALCFENLAEEQIAWLVDHIEEMYCCAGTEIFRQGEAGDRCYLIYSGKVKISRQNSHNVEEVVAVLNSPAFFGEATLMTGEPRNATAHMLEDGELLVLRHQYLAELMQKNNRVTESVVRTMIERSHPKQNPHVITFQRKTADGEDVVILKNPDNDKYCQMPLDGWKIWRQLNGEHTVSDLEHHNPREIIITLIAKLAQDHFVELSH